MQKTSDAELEERRNLVNVFGFRDRDWSDWWKKYIVLRSNALGRRVECLLTFRQYLKLAKRAGILKPAQIGRSLDAYQMSRKGDTGNYEWGNCRFLTMEQNQKEKHKNGGYAAQAEKLTGRTKFTHSYLMESGKKVSRALTGKLSKTLGRTKENHAGVARGVMKRVGRTKETHAGHARQANSLSKEFVLTSPEGIVHKGRNLKQFCLNHDLSQGSTSEVCRGVRTHHKGWTGHYNSLNG